MERQGQFVEWPHFVTLYLVVEVGVQLIIDINV